MTIAALIGGDVEAGLSLYNRPVRESETVTIPGADGFTIHPASLGAIGDIKQDIKTATWSTRGWTYQEAQLSRRILYFTPRYWFFDCPRFTHSEDGWSGVRIRFDALEGSAKEKAEGRYRCWVGVVEEFTKRHFTVETDVLDALRGIEAAVEEGEGGLRFRWGICDKNIGMEMLWTAVKGRVVKRVVKEGAAEAPSWTWVRWKGEVGRDLGLYEAIVEADVKIVGERWLRVARRMQSRFVEHRG